MYPNVLLPFKLIRSCNMCNHKVDDTNFAIFKLISYMLLLYRIFDQIAGLDLRLSMTLIFCNCRIKIWYEIFLILVNTLDLEVYFWKLFSVFWKFCWWHLPWSLPVASHMVEIISGVNLQLIQWLVICGVNLLFGEVTAQGEIWSLPHPSHFTLFSTMVT